MPGEVFDEAYYAEHDTGGDRIALWYYARAVRTLHPRGGRLLDFGCGTGHFLKRLAGRFETYGYDASAFARAQSRLNAPAARILDDWEVLEEGSVDVVTALHCLEHLGEPGELVRSLARRLVPGGLLFAVVPNPGGLGHRLKGDGWFAYRDPTHVSLLSEQEWVRLLEDAQLQVTSVRGDGMWDAPYFRGIPAALQRALFGAPAALQVFAPIARPFLPPRWGECLILQARQR